MLHLMDHCFGAHWGTSSINGENANAVSATRMGLAECGMSAYSSEKDIPGWR